MLVDGSPCNKVDHLIRGYGVVAHPKINDDGSSATNLLPMLGLGDLHQLFGEFSFLAFYASTLVLNVIASLCNLPLYDLIFG